MTHPMYEKLTAIAQGSEAVEQTVAYLAAKIKRFLKRQERVLICFPNQKQGSLGWLLEHAVRRAEGIPLVWGPDYRWKALLRQAFASRATVIIGAPLVILGLTKLAKVTGTPLFLHHIVTACYPCADWMIDGIQKGLDCQTWGVYDPGVDALICGFSCGLSRGVHLRDDAFSVEITDREGNLLPTGQIGNVVMRPKADPAVRFSTPEFARLEAAPCPCGCNSPRLMDIHYGDELDPALAALSEELLSWTSVLDCRLRRGDWGLEMEIVVFPGEKLPTLPSCAKQIVRLWEPDKDMPFRLRHSWKQTYYSWDP